MGLSPVGDTDQKGGARQNQERLMLCDICGRELELGHRDCHFFRSLAENVFYILTCTPAIKYELII